MGTGDVCDLRGEVKILKILRFFILILLISRTNFVNITKR